MTHSLIKGKLKHVCGKCGHDKTYGDIFQEDVEDER